MSFVELVFLVVTNFNVRHVAVTSVPIWFT